MLYICSINKHKKPRTMNTAAKLTREEAADLYISILNANDYTQDRENLLKWGMGSNLKAWAEREIAETPAPIAAAIKSQILPRV